MTTENTNHDQGTLSLVQAERGVGTPRPYLGVSFLVIANKGKSSAPTRSSLHWEIDVSNISVLLKQRLQLLDLKMVKLCSLSSHFVLLTSEVVRNGRFPTLREVMRSTSDGGLRKDIFSPGCVFSEKCEEMLINLISVIYEKTI